MINTKIRKITLALLSTLLVSSCSVGGEKSFLADVSLSSPSHETIRSQSRIETANLNSLALIVLALVGASLVAEGVILISHARKTSSLLKSYKKLLDENHKELLDNIDESLDKLAKEITEKIDGQITDISSKTKEITNHFEGVKSDLQRISDLLSQNNHDNKNILTGIRRIPGVLNHSKESSKKSQVQPTQNVPPFSTSHTLHHTNKIDQKSAFTSSTKPLGQPAESLSLPNSVREELNSIVRNFQLSKNDFFQQDRFFLLTLTKESRQGNIGLDALSKVEFEAITDKSQASYLGFSIGESYWLIPNVTHPSFRQILTMIEDTPGIFEASPSLSTLAEQQLVMPAKIQQSGHNLWKIEVPGRFQ